jgi:hypothetical protein
MKVIKYLAFFLLGFLFCGMMVFISPRKLTLGQEYNRGYFDCVHDQQEDDPAIIDDLYPEKNIQI